MSTLVDLVRTLDFVKSLFSDVLFRFINSVFIEQQTDTAKPHQLCVLIRVPRDREAQTREMPLGSQVSA